MNQLKIVEDSLLKILNDMVCRSILEYIVPFHTPFESIVERNAEIAENISRKKDMDTISLKARYL